MLAQSFYIGDGYTSSGIQQHFLVPDEATHLSLGFLDSVCFGYPNGDIPYAYWDNTGHLTTSFEVQTVPEPSTIIGLVSMRLAILLVRHRCPQAVKRRGATH